MHSSRTCLVGLQTQHIRFPVVLLFSALHPGPSVFGISLIIGDLLLAGFEYKQKCCVLPMKNKSRWTIKKFSYFDSFKKYELIEPIWIFVESLHTMSISEGQSVLMSPFSSVEWIIHNMPHSTHPLCSSNGPKGPEVKGGKD